MALDPPALRASEAALLKFLRAEADQQNAYFKLLSDGRVSIELEWLDVASLTRAVVAAYVGETADS